LFVTARIQPASDRQRRYGSSFVGSHHNSSQNRGDDFVVRDFSNLIVEQPNLEKAWSPRAMARRLRKRMVV
jgi:hypothetical protein